MSENKMNRRRFLYLAGGAIGATTLACVGLAAAAESRPAEQPEIQLVDTTFGEASQMNKKILVAYASETGSTSGVAEALGKQMASQDISVDVRQIKDVTDLSAYRAVVLGSAIHSGEWLPEAVKFVQDHQAELRKIPTAYFLVCMMAAKNTPENEKLVAGWLEPVRALVKPVAEGRFAGAIWLKRYSFFDGLGMRVFLSYLKLKEGDYRNWEAIRTWAENTRPMLVGLN